MAVGNAHVTSNAVGEAIESLNTLADRVRSVTLVWIPAHKGHIGNERADDLAKEGARTESPGRRLRVGIPVATVKTKVREQARREWCDEWKALKMAHHTKGFYGAPNPGKAKFVYKLARLELGRFVRIITGHNNLNFFQTKLGLANSSKCRFCGSENETITHLMEVCPKFVSLQRDMFLGKLPTADMTWSVRTLLDFSYQPEINGAFEGTWNDETTVDPLDALEGLEWLQGDGESAEDNA